MLRILRFETIPALVLLSASGCFSTMPVVAQVTPGAPHAVAGPTVDAPAETSRTTHERSYRFAVIGDYGDDGPDLAGVAALVRRWRPELILTTGDNNYPTGQASTVDVNIGKHFREFIHPYVGTFGPGAGQNRFFPTIGNHDWEPTGAGFQPHLEYFDLPGNERYYDVRRGPVHFFCLNSDTHEPDGTSSTSVQAQWLQAGLIASDAKFKVVVFHHAPYSSGLENGGSAYMVWPYRAWGADIVFAGHDHHYERFYRDGLPMIIEGRGGRSLRPVGPALAGSLRRFDDAFGATMVRVTGDAMSVRALTSAGVVIDQFVVTPEPYTLSDFSIISSGDDWSYLDDGSDQGTAWTDPFFNDSTWAAGPSQLGYGDGDEATVVSFGGDPQNVYPTTYFRRLFIMSDTTSIGSAQLRVKRDDGAVVYLNGTEIYRTNMDAGSVDYLDLATSSAGASENTWFTVQVDPALLQIGRNGLAVEVHQSHIDSPDMSFDAEFSVVVGTPLVSVVSQWSYLDGGQPPGPGWRVLGYDDASWSVGAGQFGYGEGDEDVILSFGPDRMNKPLANYFRHTFNVTDPDAFDVLLLKVMRDDGVAVRINGQEVYRVNLPAGALAGVPAAFEVTGTDESELWETTVSPSVLRVGTNVITVEVHQDSPASDDMSFALRLTGQ